MYEPEWAAVPIGMDADRWVTRAECRKVVVAVHTLVAGQRLLDVVDLVESDPRVQVVYTRAPDVFGAGVSGFLRSIGALEIPWAQAVRERFDLAIAAAYGGVDQLHGPLVLLPHGAGYGKRANGIGGENGPVYGLDAQRLLRDGRVLPSVLVLSHDEQRDVLAEQCPPAIDAALVAGDPCYDRMVLSAKSRERYRRALGVRRGRELVLVASTWGRTSLVGRDLPLFARLQRELDPKRFQVAATIHPAVWGGHGKRQLRAWLERPMARGLILVEPEVDWRPAVIAADHVIGDHGSTSVYAAAIGRSVLAADSPERDLDPGSPQALLADKAPRWKPGQRAEPQLRRAAKRLDGSLRAAVAARLTSRPGQSHRVLREKLYQLLRLPIPGKHRRPDPIPAPDLGIGGRRHA
ncbi:hypothetical protein [Actinokineospora iranica]|uniref:CDP-Glycerol:Poly(Glycerophosphate) glycerophosphotransferase n=1 Tax=Actinokineospora iranica TaxID=1271860 RepID=A0A1G6QIC4_9PSEU|nr:hypothetical protein [Actinokineospora iranica]SDC91437.1 hypothetical protein SAMN05216174_105279 [Actinokineospora iranica]